jgi:hypothetical protein
MEITAAQLIESAGVKHFSKRWKSLTLAEMASALMIASASPLVQKVPGLSETFIVTATSINTYLLANTVIVTVQTKIPQLKKAKNTATNVLIPPNQPEAVATITAKGMSVAQSAAKPAVDTAIDVALNTPITIPGT